jgi:hypothetical protein
MAKGIEIKFKNNSETYDVFTSNVLNGLYIRYTSNFSGDKLIITGNTVDFSTDFLFVKLKSKKSERKLVINLKKVLAPVLTPTPLVSSTPTPTLTKSKPLETPTATIGLTPTASATIGLTPTPTASNVPISDGSGLYLYNGFVYTSYIEYDGNNGTTKYFSSINDLYYSMLTDSSTYSNIIENIKTDKSNGIVVGAKIYSELNAQFSNNSDFYMGYFDNGVAKYIKLVNNTIAEIAELTVPTTSVTGTKILFPYFMTIGSNSGWGYSNTTADWFEYRLNVADDGLTLIYTFKNGNFDSQISNGGTFKTTISLYVNGTLRTAEYTFKPYFTINRGNPITGTLNGYKIPDMFRNSLIEIVQSVTGTSPKINGESDGDYNTRIDLACGQFTTAYHILIGK